MASILNPVKYDMLISLS